MCADSEVCGLNKCVCSVFVWSDSMCVMTVGMCVWTDCAGYLSLTVSVSNLKESEWAGERERDM